MTRGTSPPRPSRRLGLALAPLLCAIAAPAAAEPIYHQDFQSGTAPEWAASGSGDVRLSSYGDNVSLKLSGHAAARTEVSTRGRRDVVVRLKIAALGLRPRDACVGEASADGGVSWKTVVRVGRGQDDGVSLIDGALSDPAFDDAPRLWVRLRADLGSADGACWGDLVSVSGDRPSPTRGAGFDLATLKGTGPLDGLAPTSAFAPPPDAGVPAARLQGRLSLRPAARPEGLEVLADDAPVAGTDPRTVWPPLDIDLVQDAGGLIPAQRGPIPAASPEWEWVVEPGSVWSDPADGPGFTRAALPVALQERNANCLHNGAMLLLFGPDGSVADAVVQFHADTCAYYRFDAWSRVPAAWRAQPLADAEAVVARDRANRATRLPTRPIAALTEAYPTLNVAALQRAAGPFAVWGLVDAGKHYAAPCPTRAGTDSACAERDLPSYSTAKTLVGAVALMRLEQLAPGAAHERVAARVAACRGGGWDGVRLIDLLDMASGHYVSPGVEVDEAAAATLPFFTSDTAREKTAFACRQPRKEKPGRRWVYHTADTWLLGAALTEVLRGRDGPQADIYTDLVRPIWRRLELSPTLDVTRRSYDVAGQPFTGWGLTYQRDDVLRAVRFLDQGARLDGEPQLDPALLSEALQRARPGAGLTAGAPNLRYLHGVWARDVGPLIGCRHPVWTPFLSGYGGIAVVLFPNDVQFYAFGDENWFDWAAAVAEVDKIRSLCA